MSVHIRIAPVVRPLAILVLAVALACALPAVAHAAGDDTELTGTPITTTATVGDGVFLVDSAANGGDAASAAGTSIAISASSGVYFTGGTFSIVSGTSEGAPQACSVASGNATVTCAVGSIAAGDSAAFRITGTLTATGTTTVVETVTDTANTAGASATQHTNTYTVSAPAYGPTDLGVTGQSGVTVAAVGNAPSLNWTVTNLGSAASSGGTATVALPSNMTVRAVLWFDGNGTPHACAVAGGAATCHLTRISAGNGDTIQVDGYVSQAQTATWSVSFAANESDANQANNSLSGQVQGVGGAPTDLALSLTANAASILLPASEVYTATIANHGVIDANDAQLSVTLPVGSTMTAESGAPEGCTQAGAVVTCAIDPFVAGSSFVIQLTTRVTEIGTLTAYGSLSSGNVESNPADNSSNVSIQSAYPLPKGSIAKSAGIKWPTAYHFIAEPYRITQAGTTVAVAKISTRYAKILKLPVTVGSGTVKVTKAGINKYKVTLTAKAKLRFAKLHSVPLTVTVTFTSSLTHTKVVLRQTVRITNPKVK